MGLFDDLHPPIANRDALVDGTPGVDIYPDLAPAPGEHVIKKHRYSGFFGTDLDIILREWGIDTVIISGTTTENCCHATARDAMFRNYRVVFLSDATATYDYPDRGFGPMPNADVHHATSGHPRCLDGACDVGGGAEGATGERARHKGCVFASRLIVCLGRGAGHPGSVARGASL